MKRVLLTLTAVGACAAMAACTSETPAAPAPTVTVTTSPTLPSADPQLVSWLDGFCGAVHGYRQRSNANAQGKPANQTLSLGEAQVDTSKDLGQVAANAGQVVDELKALPTAPEPQTEPVKKSFLDKFTATRDRAAQAKTKLDGAKRGSETALNEATDALTALQNDVSDLYDPIKPFGTSEPFLIAAVKAPKCAPAS